MSCPSTLYACCTDLLQCVAKRSYVQRSGVAIDVVNVIGANCVNVLQSYSSAIDAYLTGSGGEGQGDRITHASATGIAAKHTKCKGGGSARPRSRASRRTPPGIACCHRCCWTGRPWTRSTTRRTIHAVSRKCSFVYAAVECKLLCTQSLARVVKMCQVFVCSAPRYLVLFLLFPSAREIENAKMLFHPFGEMLSFRLTLRSKYIFTLPR